MENHPKEIGDDSVESGRQDEGHGGRDAKFQVFIVYNGLERPLDVNPNQAIQAVLSHALALYGVQGDQTLALFLNGNTRLDSTSSVESAGIVPGTRLLLRPTQMQSGIQCG